MQIIMYKNPNVSECKTERMGMWMRIVVYVREFDWNGNSTKFSVPDWLSLTMLEEAGFHGPPSQSWLTGEDGGLGETRWSSWPFKKHFKLSNRYHNNVRNVGSKATAIHGCLTRLWRTKCGGYSELAHQVYQEVPVAALRLDLAWLNSTRCVPFQL